VPPEDPIASAVGDAELVAEDIVGPDTGMLELFEEVSSTHAHPNGNRSF
jgi:hypothetical protein